MRHWWLLERRTWKWWAIALLVRAAFFWIFLEEHGFHHSLYGWGTEGGDTPSYFQPIDSLLTGGGYQPDVRMPGYGAVYLLLRLVTTEPGSGVMMIFLQLLLGALACVALMRIAGSLGALPRSQKMLFWLAALCPQLAFLDVQLVTESFCTSALIMAILHWLMHLRKASALSLLAAGAWLAWAIFLRPVYLTVAPFLLLGLFWPRRTTAPRTLRYALLLLLPFLLADGLWTWRNWTMHHHVRPLANSLYYPEFMEAPTYAIFMYQQAYGGNQAWWDPRADIRWFNVREGEMGRPGRLADIDVEPPAVAFSERCTRDSLLLLAADMAQWSDTTTADPQRREINARATARSERLVRYFREDRPFVFHAWSRIRLLGWQLRRAGLNDLFETHFRGDPFFAPAIMWWNDLWYWTVIPVGLAFVLYTLLRFRREDPLLVILCAFLLAAVLVHPFVFRMCEGRYLVPVYPWLLLMTILCADRFLSDLRKQ